MNIKLSKRNLIVVILVVLVLGAGGTYLVLFRYGGVPTLMPSFTDKSTVSSDRYVVGGQPYEANSALSSSDSTQAPAQVTTSDSSSQFGLKILKNGSLDLLIDKGKFMEVFNRITFFTNSFSGSITNSNYTKEGENYYGTVTLIVPTKDFDKFVESVSALGKVLTFNVNSTDVTGEYVDLNSRLKVLSEQYDLLLSWLKEAKTLQDMISLRNEIQNVETEIETIKGRLNYISFHTDFSSISINLSEVNKTFSQPSEWTFITDALKNTFYYLIKSVFALLVFVLVTLPWLLFAFGIYKLLSKNKKS
jgi:hypothetical protein